MTINFTKARRFWKRRSDEQKVLFVLVTVVIILAVVGGIIAACVKAFQGPSVCRSAACVRLGRRLFVSINFSADPCEDFYSYGCGGWIKNNEIPSDLNYYGITEVLRQDVLSKLKDLLTTIALSEDTPPILNKTVTFYRSCADQDAIDRKGTKPLLRLLKEVGGWPVVSSTMPQEGGYDWILAVSKLQLSVAIGFLIRFVVSADRMNTTRNIIQLDVPNGFLDREVALDQDKHKDILDKHRNFIKTYAIYLGAEDNEILDKDIQSIIDFESDFAKISQEEPRPKYVTVAQLNEYANETDWLKYIQAITNSSLLENGMDIVTKEENILVENLSYLQSLSRLLSQANNTRQIANYLGWRAILVQRNLPSTMREVAQNFSVSLGYPPNSLERWKVCIGLVNSALKFAASHLYVTKHFPAHSKHEMEELVKDIDTSFKERLQTNDWMDEQTKMAALKKLEKMRVNIGYPDWITNVSAVEDFYKKVPVMVDDAAQNDVSISSYVALGAISNLRRTNTKDLWPMSPVVVNAGYSRNINAITFPAAFLQWPFLDFQLPRFFNYAAIGTIIGHEITHGFDNEGSKRDAEGNEDDWWSLKSRQEFLRRAKCFVKQYDNYGMRGNFTLAENMADSGGLQQAYRSYRRWMENQKNVERLPGLERLTPDQLFFVSYSSIWCTKYSPEALQLVIQKEAHCPSQYRVWGSVSNLPEFATAFDCKNKSKMYSSSKCEIW